MLKEFKEFIAHGNALDLAVAVVIGVAFGAIVTSLVNDLVMPLIGLVLGGADFTNLFVILAQGTPAGPYTTLAAAQAAGATTLNYGLFVNAVVNFVIIAVVIFMIVKGLNRLRKTEEQAEAPTKDCPHCLTVIPEAATRCPACTSALD